MLKGTLFHTLVSVSILLFATAASANDSQLSDFDKEVLETLGNNPAESEVEQMNRDSKRLMNSMFIDRARGQKRPKGLKTDDGMMVTLRLVKK